MSCTSNICIIILMVLMATCTFKTTHDEIIQNYAHKWTKKYITNATKEEKKIIIDLLLLSYQIVQTSCNMIIAKFTIQEEIFKIYTPSFIDSWHDNLQINHNDTTKLEQALSTIKESQISVTKVYEKFKKLLPTIVTINPQPTQTLISDIKLLLIGWGKDQESIPEELITIQQEFTQAVATISDIKNLFSTVSQSADIKHVFLREAAGFFAKTFHDIDHVIKHLSHIRIQNIFRIQTFFKSFFSSYYTALYQTLSPDDLETCSILATPTTKIPLPDAFFS